MTALTRRAPRPRRRRAVRTTTATPRLPSIPPRAAAAERPTRTAALAAVRPPQGPPRPVWRNARRLHPATGRPTQRRPTQRRQNRYDRQVHQPAKRTAMADLSNFPITRKWPARHPDRIQLYSLPTPNGVKVSIMLEETGLPYEAHRVSFDTQDQMSPEFLSLNSNNKIPAILDPDGPDGKPLGLFESGAILVYLADKSRRFMPQDPAARYQTLQWLMFQMGGIGHMFGQLGFFHKFAGKVYEDKRP